MRLHVKHIILTIENVDRMITHMDHIEKERKNNVQQFHFQIPVIQNCTLVHVSHLPNEKIIIKVLYDDIIFNLVLEKNLSYMCQIREIKNESVA